MLAALLCNQPYSGFGSGLGSDFRRRPNEKVVWHDEWLKAQEELTKFNALPKREKRKVTKLAIESINNSSSSYDTVKEAKDIIETVSSVNDVMNRVDALNVLLSAYYWIRFNDQRRNDEISALLCLGVL